MALSRRNGRSRATLLFLVLVSITVITLDFRGDGGGVIDAIRDAAADGLAPVRDGADTVLSPISNAWSGITGYDELEDRNAELEAEIAELRGADLRGEDVEAQLEQLLAQQQLDFVGDIPTVSARVVSAPVSNFEQTIELDRGSAHGIEVDMPVVTGDGLVGRVVDVSKKRSMVRLLTDPEASVGVRLGSVGEPGIAEGEGPDKDLSVGFVEVEADIKRGFKAVTSGLQGGSSIYPGGIPVGRVTSAEKEDGDLQQQVKLRPFVDIKALRFVKVLRYQP